MEADRGKKGIDGRVERVGEGGVGQRDGWEGGYPKE